MGIKHKTQWDLADYPGDPDDERLQGNAWNEDHIFVARAEPADEEVTEGTAFPWMSNGNGFGTNGDICIKINVAGVIKYAKLVTFSTAFGQILDEDGNAILDEDGYPLFDG